MTTLTADEREAKLARDRAWHKKNPERSRENARRWYLANRDRIREYRREKASQWIKDHPERARHRARLYAITNPEKSAEWRKSNLDRVLTQGKARLAKWRKSHPWYDSWQGAKQRCTNPNNPMYCRYGAKGIAFNLSKADMIALWARDNAHALERPSIDRKDPTKGYSFDNCQIIELSANSRKRASDRHLADLKTAGRPLTKFERWVNKLEAESKQAPLTTPDIP